MEWGVCFCPGKEGLPRIASPEWIDRLVEANRASGNIMNLIAHFTGSRSQEVLNGDSRFVAELSARGFRRVQVNAASFDGVDLSPHACRSMQKIFEGVVKKFLL